MKTQCINVDQALLGMTNSVIASIRSITMSKFIFTPKFSANKIGEYLLPLAKQLFRDNFMGSDMEMGILLVFLKGYFLSATYLISHNAVTGLFKKFKKSNANVVAWDTETIYDYKKAA